MSNQMNAIDLHTHYNHGVPDDHKISAIRQLDLPFLKQMYEAANICCGAFSSFSCFNNRLTVLKENEHAFKMSMELDWFWQWVVIDPQQEQTYEQAERMLQSPKCLGIKIHPSCHGYETPAYADQIFSFANERNAVVLTHPDNPVGVVPYVDKYPDMKLIIAHLGGEAHVEAIRQAKHGNIYTDTSGRASSENNVLEFAVEQIGSERIFFGTDTYASAFQRGRIEYARISEQDKKNILRENALRVFPKLAAALL